MSKTLIDIDDEMLARASSVLGTSTKRDTVNQALALAAAASPEIRKAAFEKLEQLAEELDLSIIEDMERADHER